VPDLEVGAIGVSRDDLCQRTVPGGLGAVGVGPKEVLILLDAPGDHPPMARMRSATGQPTLDGLGVHLGGPRGLSGRETGALQGHTETLVGHGITPGTFGQFGRRLERSTGVVGTSRTQWLTGDNSEIGGAHGRQRMDPRLDD
jgi:hypothetical protein